MPVTARLSGKFYERFGDDIANELVKTLRKGVKKIDVVDPEKVRDWARSKPSLSDPALGAITPDPRNVSPKNFGEGDSFFI